MLLSMPVSDRRWRALQISMGFPIRNSGEKAVRRPDCTTARQVGKDKGQSSLREVSDEKTKSFCNGDGHRFGDVDDAISYPHGLGIGAERMGFRAAVTITPATTATRPAGATAA